MRATSLRILCIGAIGVAQPLASQDDLLPQMAASEHTNLTTLPRLVGGRIVFSKYAADGNNSEIISVDPFTGAAESLIAPARDAALVAIDDRYIVYNTRGTSARPLVVAERATGERLASVGLRDAIVFGHIRDDRLILIQGGQRTSPALVYRLPDLVLERSTEITGTVEAQLWGERIVTVGNQLTVYDLDLRLIAAADLPPRYPDINANCISKPLRIYRDVAIVGSRCFQLAAYELPSLDLRYVLRGFGNYHGFDVVANQLFVTAETITLRVYDAATGSETARLQAPGDVFAAANGRLALLWPLRLQDGPRDDSRAGDCRHSLRFGSPRARAQELPRDRRDVVFRDRRAAKKPASKRMSARRRANRK